MPLFMLVSGYLYYYGESKYIHNLKNNIIKIMSYLIPIVTFASIKTAVNLFTGYDDRQHILFVILKEEAYNILHTLWFLWAIIYSIIILEVIRHLINGVSKQYKWKWLALLLVILMIIFLFTPDVLMGNVYKFTIPFFGIGYMLNKCSFFKNEKVKRLMPILTILYICMLFLYDEKCYVYTTGVSLIGCKFGFVSQIMIDVFRWVIGFAGAISVWGIISYIVSVTHVSELKPLAGCISYIGGNTIIIYSFSTEIINEKVYSFTCENSFSYTYSILYSIGVLAICLLISWIVNFRYMKPIKKLFTGH